MSRNIRLLSKPRSKYQYVCSLCQWRLSTLASRLPQPQQKRWITQVHIKRIKEAMEDWDLKANAIRKGEKQSMLSLLEERGYVNQIIGTREDLDYLLTERRIGAYCGVDPTAPSLHVGHLVPFMALGWLYIHGYSSTFLLGGVTAKIGDPTDRLSPRIGESRSQRKANMANMHLQLKKLGVHIENYAKRKGYHREWAWRREVANNSVWYGKVTLAEFMRVLGSVVRLGPLLGRDTVKTRLENGTGMSFDEFSYPLMQAWDWWELFKKGTQLQIGGADQFGNILAGVDAIKAMKKVEPVHFESDAVFQGHVGSALTAPLSKSPKEGRNINEPIGFTVPLLTTSAGVKFGKSEGNAIWLDGGMTSTFDLYQFFLRTADADVERYLKLFTFISIADIQGIMEEHRLDESKRVAQHRLAFEFVELIHGLGAAEQAQKQHKTLFGGNVSIDSLRSEVSPSRGRLEMATEEERPPGDWNASLNKYVKPTTIDNAPSVHMKLPRSLVVGQSIKNVLWSAGLVSSRGEGQRLVQNKGCYVASRTGRGAVTTEISDGLAFTPVKDGLTSQTENHIIDGDLLILKIGKWKMKIIKIVSDEEYEESGLTCPGWKEQERHLPKRENTKEEKQRIVEFRTEKRQQRLEREENRKEQATWRNYVMEKE